MAINVWRTPEEQRYIETRKAVRKADQEERKRLLDEQKRAELWADFDSEAILAEALRHRSNVTAMSVPRSNQRRLEELNHTAAENDLARRRCRELLEGGWGHVQW